MYISLFFKVNGQWWPYPEPGGCQSDHEQVLPSPDTHLNKPNTGFVQSQSTPEEERKQNYETAAKLKDL